MIGITLLICAFLLLVFTATQLLCLASVYVGWTQNIVFWVNIWTSVYAFRLLTNGKAVQQVCARIRSGGFSNWLFHSKLVYYGDGKHLIP